jgi:hypothetical protein
LVRADVVEVATELIEATLLSRAVRSGWNGGLGLERTVHAFVSAVLMRRGGFDEIRQNTEPYPPDGELAETSQRQGGRERHSVVGSDALRQTVLSEDARENPFGI